MMRFFLPLLCLIVFGNAVFSQSGCKDPLATNFDAAAVINDGSCVYPATTMPLTNAKSLPATVVETSGLIFTDGKLWTMNDSGNPNQIFRLDSATGTILQTVTVTNATNVDWEDLAADDTYIYIGDFGNNSNGARTNLRIYRVAKSSIGAGATVNVTAEIINFTYQDQVVVTPVADRTTNFDCEAMLIKNNVIHLFSKDWSDNLTRHYTLTNTPGTQVAVPVESFNVAGLITAADISNHNDIVLLGYTNGFNIFMYVLSDYTGNAFFSGNKRKFNIGSAMTYDQAEGITFVNNSTGFISAEKFPIGVSQRLYNFSVGSFLALPVKIASFSATYLNPEVKLNWQTASEFNSDVFLIERSGDANHFSEIGRQSAAGNSNAIINYSFSDQKPLAGMNYYRLRELDQDDRPTISAIRSVNIPNNSNGELHVYSSSAAANQLTLDYGTVPATKVSYQLMDIKGGIIKTGIVQSQFELIDISRLSRGPYILRLSDGRSVRFSKR